jgi:acrylyl-CoA reductase (NADPH)
MFDGILVDKGGVGSLVAIDDARLPAGNVTVRITHSTINYKDALAVTGRGPVVRAFPMVPGIDLAGVVEASEDPRWKVGAEVLINGFGLGETTWGGLATRARVSGDWLIAVPSGMTLARSMALGTAGFTAMLSVMALEQHGITPDRGEVLVTGAGGGVGGIAILILAHLGYNVVASTGRTAEADYLRTLGATSVIDRAELSSPGKPLGKARWMGAIDSVGSHTLANICATMKEDGVVAACGLAQGSDFPSTVMPFILRAVTLVGINSVFRTTAVREVAWKRLTAEVDAAKLDAMVQTVALADVPRVAGDLLDGKVRGRVVVSIP